MTTVQFAHELADHASTEDDSHDELENARGHSNPRTESNSASTTPESGQKEGAQIKPSNYLQKRRRVTRACDECRKKKIKCDGQQPCTHCTVYSYDCTYDQPSNRRRNPTPQYIESLEHRLHRAEALLHVLAPSFDLSDPSIDAAISQAHTPGQHGNAMFPLPRHLLKRGPTSAPTSGSAWQDHAQPDLAKADTDLESMIRAVALMDVDEYGHWDYHGHSSGLSFVRRMREQLGDMMGPEIPTTPFVKSRPKSQVIDSPRLLGDSPNVSPMANGVDLPPRDRARKLCHHALNDATTLLRVVHHPSFWKSFDLLYDTPYEQYTKQQSMFLPLFLSAVALGHLFEREANDEVHMRDYELGIQNGFAFFKAARHQMDLTDCRDLMSIQAVIFMIFFLQSSDKLPQCYTYVGIALRSALRMGLHRTHAGRFDPIEAEVRKRVFWIIRTLDITVGAMLGLPSTLQDEDIDQEFPAEVDDEYITNLGLSPQLEPQVSLMAAFNAHTRLVQILAKIIRNIYPIKVQNQPGRKDRSYSIPFSAIREIEGDLETWKNDLSPALGPCTAPPTYTRIQQMLRLSYAHAQVMLYRPFLHFTAMDKRNQSIDQRAYACGASFVNVSRNIIHITSHMKEKRLLAGAPWFVMYTAFFSILALVYFAAENPDNATSQSVMLDALEGKEIIASLSRCSMAADRCTATLDVIFSRLPNWMREAQKAPIATRKRHFDDPTQAVPLVYPSGADRHGLSDAKVGSLLPSEHAASFPYSNGGTFRGTLERSNPSWSQNDVVHAQRRDDTDLTAYQLSEPECYSTDRVHTPYTAIATLPTQTTMQNHSALPVLSAMMFPTADEPFIYPNQPLTTFESNLHLANQDADFLIAQQPTVMAGMPANFEFSQEPAGKPDAQFFLPAQHQNSTHIAYGPRETTTPSSADFRSPGPGFAGSTTTDSVSQHAGPEINWLQMFPSTGLLAPDMSDVFVGNDWNAMFTSAGHQS